MTTRSKARQPQTPLECSKVRQLRTLLELTQSELAGLSGISRQLLLAIETGRKPLSTAAAAQVAEATGVSLEWLMSDDDSQPYNTLGEPYSRADFDRRQSPAVPSVHETRSHFYFNEARLGVAYDLLCRLLAASRVEGNTAKFMEKTEKFLHEQLVQYPSLENAIREERTKASQRALKGARLVALGLLSPANPEPFKRGRERLSRALAAITAKSAPRNG